MTDTFETTDETVADTSNETAAETANEVADTRTEEERAASRAMAAFLARTPKGTLISSPDTPDIKPHTAVMPDGCDTSGGGTVDPHGIPMTHDGQIDFEAMSRQTATAVQKFEEKLLSHRGEGWRPPPPPSLEEQLAHVADIAKDHAEALPLAGIRGLKPMESLGNTPGMTAARRLLMGSPADRKAAFDALVGVQALEWLGVSHACQAGIVKQFDGDIAGVGRLLAAKGKADLHVLKLVELHAKLSTQPADRGGLSHVPPAQPS